MYRAVPTLTATAAPATQALGQGTGILRAALFAVLACAGFWLLALILRRKVFPALHNWGHLKKHRMLHMLLSGFNRPFCVYLRFAGVCAGLLLLANTLPSLQAPRFFAAVLRALPVFLPSALRIGAVVFITWGLVASSGVFALLFRKASNRLDMQTSQSATRFLSAVFSVVVVAVAVVVILSELHYDINGLIAGLGLGGLTVALAAKDSATNFFGGFVLVAERPFEIGDYISCTDVEGTVEDITLRSTKVRTVDGSLTIVPNGLLAAEPITNRASAMEKRRVDFVLNIAYGAGQESLRAFAHDVCEALEKDEQVHKDGIVVRFADFGESSLGLRIIYYTALPGYADYLQIRERVNFLLMQLAEGHGIHFAYPTRTVRLEGAPITLLEEEETS